MQQLLPGAVHGIPYSLHDLDTKGVGNGRKPLKQGLHAHKRGGAACGGDALVHDATADKLLARHRCVQGLASACAGLQDVIKNGQGRVLHLPYISNHGIRP
jgi:hypothetical protein